MFTIDDLWRIINYLKDGTTDGRLSELTQTLSASEREIATKFFENTLDQPVFSSDDYQRLRNWMIDWYASHRTISSTQRNASDVHALPNDHLSELFRSFGFEIGLNLVPLTAKANFFLDLVNFYKKKGTPETLTDVLDYYGFSDTDLIEYWLLKDEFGNFVFRGEPVRRASTGSTILSDTDVAYATMIQGDPHWLIPEANLPTLIANNKINLPSKSPYFSLSSVFYLDKLVSAFSVMTRIVQDQYWDRYDQGLELPQNVAVKNVGEVVSLLEVYIGTIYVHEQMFGYPSPTLSNQFWCYNLPIDYGTSDPPIPRDLTGHVAEYEDLIVRPLSRADRDAKIAQLLDEWSRPIDSTSTPPPVNFLKDQATAAPLLTTMNPQFKEVLDSWFTSGDQSYLLTYLIGTLDNWIRVNVDSKSPSLVITMLGLGFREEVSKIVNFFKPYRARLAFVDTAYSINNPLMESILIDEIFNTTIRQSHWMDVMRDAQASDSTTPLDIDYIFTVINQTHIDDVGMGNYVFDKPDYDMGGIYDDGINYDERWHEVVVIGMYQRFRDDVVIVADELHKIIHHEVPRDYPRGVNEEGILGFDVGFDFDEIYRVPIVTDYMTVTEWPPFPEEIIELPNNPEPARGFYSGPVIMDMGHEYDELMPAPIVEDRIEILNKYLGP